MTAAFLSPVALQALANLAEMPAQSLGLANPTPRIERAMPASGGTSKLTSSAISLRAPSAAAASIRKFVAELPQQDKQNNLTDMKNLRIDPSVKTPTHVKPGRVGVLLASHGDIDSLDELEDYVKTAVIKNRAVPLPDWSRAIAAKVGWAIVKGSITDQYENIGVKTQYRSRSDAQSKALEAALKNKGIDARVRYGFNFAKPSVADALEDMRREGVDRVLVFNQGAQYSFATGAENFRDTQSYFSEQTDFAPEVTGIRQFSNDPRFRDLLARRLQEDVDRQFPGIPYDDVLILLGSHGLPDALAQKGDPAAKQMIEAASAITDQLPESIAVKQGFLNDDFFPGATWTHPTAQELADEIAASGRKHVLLDGRLSFTVHHRATLFDLNVEARAAIQERVPGAIIRLANNFDDDPELANLLADLTLEALSNQGDTETIDYTATNAP